MPTVRAELWVHLSGVPIQRTGVYSDSQAPALLPCVLLTSTGVRITQHNSAAHRRARAGTASPCSRWHILGKMKFCLFLNEAFCTETLLLLLETPVPFRGKRQVLGRNNITEFCCSKFRHAFAQQRGEGTFKAFENEQREITSLTKCQQFTCISLRYLYRVVRVHLNHDAGTGPRLPATMEAKFSQQQSR